METKALKPQKEKKKKEMDMFFHEATQPISGDILHQWQTIVTVGQSAAMSACLANTSVHSAAHTESKGLFLLFFWEGGFSLLSSPQKVSCGLCKPGESDSAENSGFNFDLDLSVVASQWINNNNNRKKKNDWPAESVLRLGLKPGWFMKFIGRLEDSVVT